MSATIVVADDTGTCFGDFIRLLGGTELRLELARTPDDCVLKVRSLKPEIVVVYAVMNKAFSLMRSLRHEADLASVPMLVVGELDQEELMQRHRQLPSRADRYMVRPLEPDMLRKVVFELLGGESPVPTVEMPAAGGAAPSAFDRMDSELAQAKSRIAQLEKDLEVASSITRDYAQLKGENESLKERLLTQEPQGNGGFDDLFHSLEAGYKETIEDLQRLVQEKDEIISRMASTTGDLGPAGARRASAEAVALYQSQVAELKKVIRQVYSALSDMEAAENEVDLAEIADLLEKAQMGLDEEDTGFGTVEKTVVVSAKDLNK